MVSLLIDLRIFSERSPSKLKAVLVGEEAFGSSYAFQEYLSPLGLLSQLSQQLSVDSKFDDQLCLLAALLAGFGEATSACVLD